MGFNKDFVWGVATSAYQIEGAADTDGKGKSIWDVFAQQQGAIFEGHTGEVACDHYHRMEEDVRLMAGLGVKAYRFSISWARVLPEGIGRVNEKGIAFYERLVDLLLEYNITPYVTLYHWDLPYALYLKGGWMNPESPQWFANYVALIGKRFKDKVKHFITFNEPQVFIGCSFIQGVHAPGVKMGRRECLQMSHHVLLAHGRAVQALRGEVADVKIGYAPTSDAAIPVSASQQDIAAARKAYFATPGGDDWVWSVSWWSDPVLLGKYPEDGMKNLEPDLPRITPEDMQLISQPIDFYGQNIYRGNLVCEGKNGEPEFLKHKIGGPKTAIGWHVNFDCLYWGTKFLYERYQKPIYITENGMSSHDWVSIDGKIHDMARIDYLQRHLQGLRCAAEEGADIAGYFQWSLMDNFEWSQGYSERFGLVYVDFQSLERIPKDSYYWYHNTIAKNGTNL